MGNAALYKDFTGEVHTADQNLGRVVGADVRKGEIDVQSSDGLIYRYKGRAVIDAREPMLNIPGETGVLITTVFEPQKETNLLKEPTAQV